MEVPDEVLAWAIAETRTWIEQPLFRFRGASSTCPRRPEGRTEYPRPHTERHQHQEADPGDAGEFAYGPSTTNPQSARRTVTLYEVAPAGIGTQKTARLPAGTPAMTSRSLVLTTWPALSSP